MKLEDLYSMIAKDFPIDKADLGFEAGKTTTLWIKYQKIMLDEKLKLELMNNRIKALENEKREYYSGKADPSVYAAKPFNIMVKTAAGVEKYVQADAEVIKYNDNILIQTQKVEALYGCMDEIKRRGYSIKAMIDWYKFQNGG